MAVVDNAGGITQDATGQHNNGKLLDGLPAATATGQAMRWDEAAPATVAKTGGYTQIAKGTLTLGTAATLSLTDASFTGKTAGGRGDLQGASGVLGIVAGSFASSAAETSTGANQAGLGSAAAATQPYNVTDFPGQYQYAQCVLLTANRQPITLVQMVAGTITDATAEVYGYLSFRSDLGANLKWRLWFYYRRASDGFEVPVTPTISLSNCWLEVPEIFLASALAPGFGLSQTTAGPAVSSIPTLDKVPAPVAAVAFNSQEATGLATPAAATSAATRNYADGGVIAVQGCTTAALPAYTITSGTVAAGTAIFTASGNGAFPTLDGNAAITASTTEAISSRFLFHHGASTLDNCVATLTQQGDAGTPYIFKMYSGLNTNAKIVGSHLRVLTGIQNASAEYAFIAYAGAVLGTKPIFYWRQDKNQGARNQRTILVDTDWCDGALLATANSAAGDSGFNQFNTGAGAQGQIASTNGTSSKQGFVQLQAGTTTTGRGCLIQSLNANLTVLGTNTGFHLDIKPGLAVLSDGTNTFSFKVGLTDAVSAIASSASNEIAVTFQPLVSTTNLLITTAATAGITNTDSGRTIAAGTDDHVILHKDPGDNTIYPVVNGTIGAGITTNISANPMGLCLQILKSAGTTNRSLDLDWTYAEVYVPQGRAS